MKFSTKEKHFDAETPEEAFLKLFQGIEDDLNEVDRIQTAKGSEIKSKQEANPAGTLLNNVFTGGECQEYQVKKGLPFQIPEFLAVTSGFIAKYGFNPKFDDKNSVIKNYIANDMKITVPKSIWESIGGIFNGKYKEYDNASYILKNAMNFMNDRLVRIRKSI